MSPKLLLIITCLIYTTYCVDPENHPHSHHDHNHEDHGFPNHKCIHDEIEDWKIKNNKLDVIIQQDLPVVKSNETYIKRGFLQTVGPVHNPLRVYISSELLEPGVDEFACYAPGQVIQALSGGNVVSYRCADEDVITASKKDYLLNTLLKGATDWLESALSVVRNNGRMILNIPQCTSTPLNVPVANIYRTNGVDADFVLFVTSRPILSSSTLAFASSCASNNIGRPIAGQANFNTSNLVNIRGDFPRQVGISIHEICHALGFSQFKWLYGNFIQYTSQDATGNWQYIQVPSSSIYETVNGAYQFDRIITPTVQEVVRNHFGCNNLRGADLEDGGSSGTAGSHWEKRIFMNEFMTGSDSNYPVLSNITLALFLDTGWYRVNFEASQILEWGRSLGCNFVTEDCSKWVSTYGNSVMGLCDQQSTDVVCSFDRRGYGQCNILDKNPNPIPSYFQHWAGRPTKGGQNPLADYCGYVGQNGITTYCNTGGSNVEQLSDTLNIFGIAATGEQFELQSRCMYSTLNRINTPLELNGLTSLIAPSFRSTRCYNQTCVSPTDLRIQLHGVWYSCPPAGGDIVAAGVVLFDFSGTVECPPASYMCKDAVEDKTWPRSGTLSPTAGPPNTNITITGNFMLGETYTVVMDIPCTNVVLVNNNTITAVIPGGDHFVSVLDLTIFQTKKNVYVRDSRGYTANFPKSFTIEVNFDTTYLRNLFNWMSQNPLWAFVVWACILVPLFCICCCIYKCVKSRPKKPKRGVHHAQTKPEEFYEDDYEVDDYYDDQKNGNDNGGNGQGNHGGNAGYNFDDSH